MAAASKRFGYARGEKVMKEIRGGLPEKDANNNVINLKQTIFILKKLDVFCFFLYAYIVKKNHEPAAEKDVMLMKHSQKRTFMDIEKMSSNEFKAFCRQTAQTLIFLPLLKRWNCMVLQAEKIQNPRLK